MVIAATYLGWTLDAFDFFLMVFLQKSISEAFGTSISAVAEALFLTLATRPLGALVFGWLADRHGRRPVLMVVVLMFSALSALSGLAQSLGQLLLIRAAFGFAMGGEWGIGTSLAMESIPARLRGRISGLLQSGYPSGYLLASAAFALFFDRIGWRGMFFLGLAPAFLVLIIRLHVDESPSFTAARQGPRQGVLSALAEHWKLALYLVVLMTAFNFLSHGTQDLYPTFLQKQHGFGTRLTGTIAVVMNVGAIVGAFIFGSLSERIGRRRAIIIASLCALPLIPLWAYGTTPLLLALGAFLMQAAVQGAWAVVPAYLSELSPASLRAMFPGFVYQLGNLIASRNAVIQARIAESHHGNYSLALASVAGITVVVLALWSSLGPERRGTAL
ncbi:MAG: MFS transporter [Pseudomonadota bacterium]|nr:MFS transporter [Pseudomonadota bacterium]